MGSADHTEKPGEQESVRWNVGIEVEESMDQERESGRDGSDENTLTSARRRPLLESLARSTKRHEKKTADHDESGRSGLAQELYQVALGELGAGFIGVCPVGRDRGTICTEPRPHDGRSQGESQ